MNSPLDAGLKRIFRTSVTLSILLIILGVAATALPIATSIGVVIVIGWLVVFDGVAQFVHAFQSEGIGHIVWKLLVAVLYLAAGAYLVAHPALGATGFTLVLGIFLFAEGVTDVIAYLYTRKSGSSGWVLADGIINLALGFMIWNRWPFGSLWVIGSLVGISMVMSGITRLMLAFSIRKIARQVNDHRFQDRAA